VKVLGEGQFSRVIIGSMKLTKEKVAVKLAKPSADVELFKSMLTEVKIMIYVGYHENIIGLMGVCTQGIRRSMILIINLLIK